MKKLILSAVFALACFTAQANNEIIKNDDDKNPKAYTVPLKSCTVYASTVLDCPDGPTVVGTVRSSSNCFFAAILAEWALATASC